MQTVLRVLAAITLGSLIVLLWAVILILNALKPTIETTLPATLRDAHVTVLEVGLTAKNLREASVEWKNASKAQAAEATATEQQAEKAIADLDAMIRRTDGTLNETLGPQLTLTLKSTQELSVQAARDLQQTTDGLEPSLRHFAEASGSAAELLADPKIRETVEHLDAASAGVQKTTEEFAATSTDVRQVADKFRSTYLQPQKFAWALFKELLGMGSQAVQFAK